MKVSIHGQIQKGEKVRARLWHHILNHVEYQLFSKIWDDVKDPVHDVVWEQIRRVVENQVRHINE